MKKLVSNFALVGFILLIFVSVRYPHSHEFQGMLNVRSLLLVGLGHLFIIFYSYSFLEIFDAWKKIWQISFKENSSSIEVVIEKLVPYSRQLQKSGRISDPTLVSGTFFKDAVDIFNNNYTITELKRILKNKWDVHRMVGLKQVDLLTFGAAVAPALGLIGTILGLISLLQNMEDFSRIGAGMALALLATFYGLVLSYGIYQPLARRLQLSLDDEGFVNGVVIEGLELMKTGVHGPVLREHLNAFQTASEPRLRKTVPSPVEYNTVSMEIE